jgi:hypothetical protein
MRGESCYASNVAIGTILNSKPNTISRSLKKLEDKRYITLIYSDPETRVRRSEIIPHITMGGSPIKRIRTIPNGVVTSQKTTIPNGVDTIPNGIVNYPKWDSSKKGLKSSILKEEKLNISQKETTGGGETTIPNGVEIYNTERRIRNKIKKELPLRGQTLESTGKKNGQDFISNKPSADFKINNVIALFLPLFPGDFANKKSNPFNNQTTRDVVEALMNRKSVDEIKYIIQKYSDGEYKGEWKNDNRHGEGKFFYKNMKVCSGIWIDDQMHGIGVCH